MYFVMQLNVILGTHDLKVAPVIVLGVKVLVMHNKVAKTRIFAMLPLKFLPLLVPAPLPGNYPMDERRSSWGAKLRSQLIFSITVNSDKLLRVRNQFCRVFCAKFSILANINVAKVAFLYHWPPLLSRDRTVYKSYEKRSFYRCAILQEFLDEKG